MVKKFISTLVLVVALVGTVSAQNLDDLSKKVFDLSFGVINKGINAYEEQLEKQELEEAKKIEEETKKAEEERKAEEAALEAEAEDEYWEAIDILNRCVFCDPINKNIFVKCYCYPIEDFVWYRAFIYSDGKIWVTIFYDNGEIGEILFAGAMQGGESTSYTESVTGIKTPALKITFTSGDLLFIQDTSDPYRFAISW